MQTVNVDSLFLLHFIVFKEMDDLVLQLRQLVDTDPSEAACIFVQAKSILDETDRLISSKLPITSSFVQQQQQQPTNATSSATV